MKILFVDTTTSDLVVAVINDNSVCDLTLRAAGVRHSEMLCNKVQEVLKSADLSFVDLDAYACAIGPGSFTGIRIGVSTIKGYGIAVAKPFIAVNCLQAIAMSSKCGCKGSAVIDAGNGYYFADYINNIDSCLIEYDDPKALSAGRAESAVDYFDGAVQIIRSKYIENQFDERLTPLYIRRSQAEECR